jgi:protein-S-isoprenylcysteine O-methyltransferase Ste14
VGETGELVLSTLKRTSRTTADWVGCLFFCAFAITIPLTSGSSGLLLLPPMLYEVAVAATFLLRNRARRSLQGLMPRLISYVATFFLPLFIWIAIRWIPSFFTITQSPLLRTAGASFWLFGTVLSFWPIWYMRRSFSIEPAARELATNGPYRIARHPIYATQLLEYLGIWMLHATVAFAAALVGWLIIVRVRMRYEEQVLRDEFPEYASYQQRVGAFGPRLRPVLALSGE